MPPPDSDAGGAWEPAEDFEEIPPKLLRDEDYRLTRRGRWKLTEDIHLQEGRALGGALERHTRTAYGRHQRKLFLIDNMGNVLAFERCRAKKFELLSLVRRWSGLRLARNIRLAVRWIPSELNVADGASRGSNGVGYAGGGSGAGAKEPTRDARSVDADKDRHVTCMQPTPSSPVASRGETPTFGATNSDHTSYEIHPLNALGGYQRPDEPGVGLLPTSLLGPRGGYDGDTGSSAGSDRPETSNWGRCSPLVFYNHPDSCLPFDSSLAARMQASSPPADWMPAGGRR